MQYSKMLLSCLYAVITDGSTAAGGSRFPEQVNLYIIYNLHSAQLVAAVTEMKRDIWSNPSHSLPI